MNKRYLSNLNLRVTPTNRNIRCQCCATYAGTMINSNRFHLDHINIMELKPLFIAVGSRVRLMMEGQIIRCESARLSGFLEAAVTYPPHNIVPIPMRNLPIVGDVRVVSGVEPAAGSAPATGSASFANDPAPYEVFHSAVPINPSTYEPARAITPAAYEAVPFGNDTVDMTNSDDEEQIESVNMNVFNVLKTS